MSLSRTAVSSRGCSACRTAIVRSFTNQNAPNAFLFTRTSFAPLPTVTPSLRSFSITRRRNEKEGNVQSFDSILIKDRGFVFGVLEDSDSSSAPTSKPPSSTPTSSTEPAISPTVNETLDKNSSIPSDKTETNISEESLDAPSSQSPPIPWYLQSQHKPIRTAPETESTARQIIPDLPPNPPPLLQTILDYVSITAGLDDLTLFDLRHLDPPPALGPKLIMIIGTARSEKHLHVSADRFCRWLRREHGLRANAAGLLGRNELKIKLRRKMKRMKMLANAGAPEPEGNIDDGIRTGWICCTLGKLEAHPEDTKMPGADVENFVGFRDVKPGVNVVVQMFTEEKRVEIDLETLWGGVMRTHDRRDREADETLKMWDVEEEEIEDDLSQTTPSPPGVPRPAASRPSSDPFPAPPPAYKPATSRPPGNPFSSPTPASESAAPELPSDPFPLPSPDHKPATAASRPPSDPFPAGDEFPPRRRKGSNDVFPPASNHNTAGQLRRLHTVGSGSRIIR